SAYFARLSRPFGIAEQTALLTFERTPLSSAAKKREANSLNLIPHLFFRKIMSPTIHRVPSTVPDLASRRRSQRHEAGHGLQDKLVRFQPSPTVGILSARCVPVEPTF